MQKSVTAALLAIVLAAGGLGAQARPSRVISLVPAVTEILFAIGAGPQVVAVSSYDQEPPAVTSLPRVGALLDPNLERILSLRPDLVVVYGSQQDLKAQLDRAQIPMFSYVHAGLPDVTETIRALGARTGHTDGAERVALDIERRLASIRQRVAGAPRPRTLLVFGREPGTLRNLYASGGIGFLHDMLEAAGGANVYADEKHQSVQASSEMLLAARPEVILELRVADEPVDVTPWQAVPSIPAVRVHRIITLVGTDLVTPGPRVAAATERLARALHPDRF
jgi:iron complex transport system substrate-binding protein